MHEVVIVGAGGTSRMGVDADAVVTPDLRPRDLEALGVVDTSLIPVPRASTSWPTVMVAGRAAEPMRAA